MGVEKLYASKDWQNCLLTVASFYATIRNNHGMKEVPLMYVQQ
jgi:hypothetical protein